MKKKGILSNFFHEAIKVLIPKSDKDVKERKKERKDRGKKDKRRQREEEL